MSLHACAPAHLWVPAEAQVIKTRLHRSMDHHDDLPRDLLGHRGTAGCNCISSGCWLHGLLLHWLLLLVWPCIL